MKQAVLTALAVVAMCTAASMGGTSYTNTTGGTVYQLDVPTAWDNIGAAPVELAGGGPNGGSAYYKPGATGGNDDSTRAYWDFSFASLPNVGHDLVPGEYKMQAYVTDYAAFGLAHEGDGVFGSWNGPWGYDANGWGIFSSWNGVPQGKAGWTDMGDWTGGYVWLSSDTGQDQVIAAKWNPWGGYGGLAVSGVRISTDGNFTSITPEPTTILLLVVGGLFLNRRRHA